MALNRSTWTKTEALAVAGADPVAGLAAARAHVLSTLMPVPADEEGLAEWRLAMAARIDPIGAKVSPTMAQDQAAAWRDAVIDALDDLPATVAITAAKRALRSTFRWPSEVDAEIRRICCEMVKEREDAAARLQWLIGEIQRAADPELPSPDEMPIEPFSDDEIRRMSPEMRALGMGVGALSEEQIDRVLASTVPDENKA